MEEGRERERKVWERERYKNLQDQGVGGWGIPRDRSSSWTRCREQWAGRLGSQKGRGREAALSGQRGHCASGAKAMGTFTVRLCGQGTAPQPVQEPEAVPRQAKLCRPQHPPPRTMSLPMTLGQALHTHSISSPRFPPERSAVLIPICICKMRPREAE